MIRKSMLLLALCIGTGTVMAQDSDDRDKLQRRLEKYFENYKSKTTDYDMKAQLSGVRVNDEERQLAITANDRFAEQEFTPEVVEGIYKKVRRTVPDVYEKYDMRIYTKGMEISELIPNRLADRKDPTRTWRKTDYTGKPWVTRASQPFEVTEGLQGRHLTIAASHGRFYDGKRGTWRWQRPNLFCTTEDLFTHTIVVPYLMPMLENAGAIVFSPRERDWQRREVIVDNDGASGVDYTEVGSWNDIDGGFARHDGTYRDGENPFRAGTARMTRATRNRDAMVSYQPRLTSPGKYAVYVSYKTVEGSVDDAEYIVVHQGRQTHFHVNQRMGGGTWVYLGTFDFDAGSSEANRVVLSSKSSTHGVVTADAVRFGGGMGNIQRGGSTSRMPRALEGARYYAQWAGAPYSVYGQKEGKDDYSDDINTRSLFSNWVGGGSVFIPNKSGLGVPIELELAVHSDAGFDRTGGNNLIGTLSICTTEANDGKLDAGISRMASRDLADALLDGVYRDVQYRFKNWRKRVMYDRGYSESKHPAVPSSILETLSHQNFGDMRYGLDPNFRFTMARSIYKTILRFVNDMHDRPFVVQPLQPNHFQVEFTSKNKVKLSWEGVRDPQESSATPTGYNLYCAMGDRGWDNGTHVKHNQCQMELEPGVLYHFRVTATNQGGESFPTEVLSACYQPGATHTVLVVNGFHRLSGPAIIDTGDRKGFDLDADPGVTRGIMASWTGKQTVFDNAQRGKEGPGALGYSGDELLGRFYASNTFDYVRTHAEAIHSARRYNIVSCASEAVESGKVRLERYDCVDLLLGLEKNDGHSLVMYKSFSNTMQQRLQHYMRQKGSLMVSGSYIGADMTETAEQRFLQQVLKVRYGGSDRQNADPSVTGLGSTFSIYKRLNEDHYAAHAPDILQAADGAICAMLYSDRHSAAVASSSGDTRTFVMGFPFECITQDQDRGHLMRGIMNYLLQGKRRKK